MSWNVCYISIKANPLHFKFFQKCQAGLPIDRGLLDQDIKADPSFKFKGCVQSQFSFQEHPPALLLALPQYERSGRGGLTKTFIPSA